MLRTKCLPTVAASHGPNNKAPSGGLIILACLAWTIFVPFPGPFDDIVVWAIGAWMAMKGK